MYLEKSNIEPLSQFVYARFVYGQIGSYFFAQKGRVVTISKTIYIRNVDPAVLVKIDELAEQKGVSRNKFVNIILESFVFTDKIKETEEKYSGLVETTAEAINNFTLALQQLQQMVIQSNIDNRKDEIL